MALQDRLDVLKSDFESGRFPLKPSREALDTMHRGTAELIASGQAQRALKAGDRMPEFSLRDSDGRAVSSHELLARGPLVISFYRGVWCPYCNLELQALQSALPEIAARGASLVAISPQTAANSRKSQRDNTLGFPILSDSKSEVANAFGIRFALPDYLVELADAGALRDRHRRHYRLCGSQSRLHPASRSHRVAAGAGSSQGQQGRLTRITGAFDAPASLPSSLNEGVRSPDGVLRPTERFVSCPN
jgi:peroxiredoxin